MFNFYLSEKSKLTNLSYMKKDTINMEEINEAENNTNIDDNNKVIFNFIYFILFF